MLTQLGFKGVESLDANTATVGIQIQESGNRFTIYAKFTGEREKVLVYTFLPLQVEPTAVPAAVWKKIVTDYGSGLSPAHVGYLDDQKSFIVTTSLMADKITPQLLNDMVLFVTFMGDDVTQGLKQLLSVQ